MDHVHNFADQFFELGKFALVHVHRTRARIKAIRVPDGKEGRHSQ